MTSLSYASNPSSASLRPTPVPVRLENIPRELTLLHQWVVWRWRRDETKGRWKKPPYNPRTGIPADHSDPATWGTFAEAVATYQSGSYAGIGFVLSKTDAYAGIDLDDCRDPATSVVAADAWKICCELASYTEVSPSGTGLKAIVRAKLPPGRRKGKVGTVKTEMYDEGRYFTITGWRLDNFPHFPADRQAEVAALHARLLPLNKAKRTSNLATTHAALNSATANQGVLCLTDCEVTSLLTATATGRNLWAGKQTLWQGEEGSYVSQSEADAALVSQIARFTTDVQQIDRLFRQSGLSRPKWDESHSANGDSYGASTIANALSTNSPVPVIKTETYKRATGSAKPVILIPLSIYRQKIEVAFQQFTLRPGIVLLNSPCGTSKTYSLLQLLQGTPASLIVAQSHRNCRENATKARKAGLHCVAHPEIQRKNCKRHREAKRDEKRGFTVLETTCVGCPHETECDKHGYRAKLREFKLAPHQIVTAARLTAVGVPTLAQHKQVVAVLEDVANTLRPAKAVSIARLRIVKDLLSHLTGHEDRRVREYADALSQSVLQPLSQLSRSGALAKLLTSIINVKRPRRWYLALKEACKELEIGIRGDVLHAVMDIAEGRKTAVFRPKREGPGGHPNQLVLTQKNFLLPYLKNIVEDATASQTTVERILGTRIQRIRPRPYPEPLHRVVQIPLDVTKHQVARTVNIVRALLLLRPQARRVGIICHKKHKRAVRALKKQFPGRIKKIDHFRSGPSRGSNEWYMICDLLLVVGTHRPGDAAVQLRHIAEDNLAAAQRTSTLTQVVHIGLTESGQRKVFLSLKHTDPEWDRVHTELVHSESLQNVGRSRHILPDGIPETIVVSNENLEIPLWDDDFHPVKAAEADLYFQLLEMAALPVGGKLNSHSGGGVSASVTSGGVRESPSIYLRENRAPTIRLPDDVVPETGISQRKLAKQMGISESTVRGRLRSLLVNKLVAKCRKHGLWPLVPQPNTPANNGNSS